MLVRAFGASAFWPTRRDSHGGRSDECLSRARIACRHYAINSNPYEPPTRQEARGVDAPFKGVGVHSTHKGEETGGKPVSREETTLLSIRAPYLRPLIALSQRFRSCTGTSVLLKTPGAYTRVEYAADLQGPGARGLCDAGACAAGTAHTRCALAPYQGDWRSARHPGAHLASSLMKPRASAIGRKPCQIAARFLDAEGHSNTPWILKHRLQQR